MSKVIVNGNPRIKADHIFVKGQGPFYPTLEIAIEEGHIRGGVGHWEKTFDYEGKTYFQAGNTNMWD